jgi:hypothetical protein
MGLKALLLADALVVAGGGEESGGGATVAEPAGRGVGTAAEASTQRENGPMDIEMDG